MSILKIWELGFGVKIAKIMTKSKSRQDCVNHIFNPSAFFLFLLAGATWYYHAIYIVFTQFASFTDCEDGIFKVISNLHVQGYKFGGKQDKFVKKSEGKKIEFWRTHITRFFATLHLIPVTWHMTCDTWHMTWHEMWHMVGG